MKILGMERLRLGLARLRCCVSLLQAQSAPLTHINPLSHVGRRSVHLSCSLRSLDAFFDDKDKLESGKQATGRPWRKDELRIKSNTDLHKLWYVLLKERNMLMTMEHMHRDQHVYLPNPERIDKVEESMENVLEVIKERDEAYQLLEKGDDKSKKPYATRNMAGIPYYRTPTEHYIPKHMNRYFRNTHPEYKKWMGKYLDRYEEKLRLEYDFRNAMFKKRKGEMLGEFPHLSDDDFEHMKPHFTRLEKYLEAAAELGDRVEKPA